MFGSKKTARWTQDDDRRLIELAASGLSLSRIAIQLGRTPIGIRRRAKVLGVRVKSVAQVRKSYGL